MTTPLWSSGSKKADRTAKNLEQKKARANFVVEYELYYDNGLARWEGFYRTYFSARIISFWNIYFASWGGNAELFTYPRPVIIEEEKSKKGIFHGRK